MRPIDADVLLAVARDMQSETEETAYNFLNDAQNPSTEWECVEGLIENAPTLDVAPVVHAHWIEESYEYYKAWQEAFGTENFFRDCEYFTDHIACSNCLKSYNIMDNDSAGCWKFCPNCGAKIDGKDGEQNADE